MRTRLEKKMIVLKQKKGHGYKMVVDLMKVNPSKVPASLRGMEVVLVRMYREIQRMSDLRKLPEGRREFDHDEFEEGWQSLEKRFTTIAGEFNLLEEEERLSLSDRVKLHNLSAVYLLLASTYSISTAKLIRRAGVKRIKYGSDEPQQSSEERRHLSPEAAADSYSRRQDGLS